LTEIGSRRKLAAAGVLTTLSILKYVACSSRRGKLAQFVSMRILEILSISNGFSLPSHFTVHKIRKREKETK
jgi:hypothetical protein